ncbi:putative quinol monooxygenase [Halomonas sp. HNIBRBA4712]|uniref:putative quinol monooxygenase n=1 Tax=Halomonas sp. HNIBRBA4712 TaxID=3373087 RepID=UPI003746B8B1
MAKVMLKGTITVPEAELDTFLQALMRHRQQTLAEPGCIMFDVIQDQADPCRYNVFETFVDRTAFDHHQRRVANSEWGRPTRNAVRHYEIIE